MSALLLVMLVALSVTSASGEDLVSNACMGCICEASSRCDIDTGCSNGFCGAFRIARGYWQDSRFDRQSYEQCTGDVYCSAKLVNSYIGKFNYDCDGDGSITCRDYAFLHRAGPGGCRMNAQNIRTSKYWEQFEACHALFPDE